jgi:hypothetical protein
MKTRKILEKLGQFLNADRAAQHEELESIRKILKQLKGKELKLREKLATVPDAEEREELAAKLEVVHAQRLKGIERVTELRASQKVGREPPKETG